MPSLSKSLALAVAIGGATASRSADGVAAGTSELTGEDQGGGMTFREGVEYTCRSLEDGHIDDMHALLLQQEIECQKEDPGCELVPPACDFNAHYDHVCSDAAKPCLDFMQGPPSMLAGRLPISATSDLADIQAYQREVAKYARCWDDALRPASACTSPVQFDAMADHLRSDGINLQHAIASVQKALGPKPGDAELKAKLAALRSAEASAAFAGEATVASAKSVARAPQAETTAPSDGAATGAADGSPPASFAANSPASIAGSSVGAVAVAAVAAALTF